MSRNKRVGPSWFKKERSVVTCTTCSGRGVTKGIFHEMACGDCHGAGLVDGETGEALEPLELVLQLRLRLNRAKDIIQKYRQSDSDRGYGSEKRGFGPDGKRYHGD